MSQDWVYRVQDGDNIWNLCHGHSNYPNCWLQLGDYNGLANRDRLKPGSRLRIPIHWLSTVPQVGEVLSVSGEVHYQAFAGQTVQLQAGQALTLGATLTSTEGSARIRVGEHGVILIRPHTVLVLESLSTGSESEPTSELRLPQGDTEIQVKPEARSNFEVHTPSAVAAVRGTCFRVSTESVESMRGEVTCGMVAVTADATVDVPAGFGVQARAGEAPQPPRKLLPAPIIDGQSLRSPLPVTLRWDPQPGAVRWNVDIFEQGENGALLGSHQVDTPELVLASMDEGCYDVQLRSIDEAGFNGMDIADTLCVLPPAPVVEEPQSYLELGIWSVLTALLFLL